MSAKEMFEELGYEVKYYIKDSKLILIGYTLSDADVFECDVIFNTQAKVFVSTMSVDRQLYKAINKQIEELHWND